VLTRDAAIPLLNALVAVPATRTVRGLPSEVLLEEGDGVPLACALALDNIARIPKQRFEQRICTLSTGRLDEVCAALRFATDC
jgi:mRNA interferase MazF